MDNFFIQIYNTFHKKKVLGFGLLLILFLLLGFIASKLQFEEDITKLIPSSEKSNITSKVLEHVNFADKIIVYLETGKENNEDNLTQYASEFIDSLRTNCSSYISEIQGEIEDTEISETLDFIYQNIPLFLDETDYKTITNRIVKDSIKQLIEVNYRTLISPTGIIAKETILKDPLGLSFLGLKKLQQLKIDDSFTIHNGFIITKDSKNLLLFIIPKLAANETDGNTIFVDKLYEIQERLNQKFKNEVSSEYYGSTVIAVANANQIKHDIQFTISIALSILLLILIFFYRKLLVPIILFIPTIFGALVAIAVLFFIKQKISAISLGIGSVLLGITLDYSLHVLTHFRNNNNVNTLYKDVTKPILMSSITTAVAFLCLLFLKSEALQDLGIFAAVSVISASVFALLFIPQAYTVKGNKSKQRETIIDKIASYRFSKNKYLVIGFVLIFLMSLFTYRNVIFEKDISKINFQTEALKTTEKKLDKLTNMASKSIYVTTYGNTVDEALQHNDSIFKTLNTLKQKNDIISFSSIGSIVLSQKLQQEKMNRWNNFWTSTKKESLQEELVKNGIEVGFKPTTFKKFYALLDSDFKSIPISEYRKLKMLFVDEFVSTKSNDFATAVSLVKVKSDNLKMVVDKFDSIPQTVVIDRQHMNETFLGNLKDDFNKLIVYSLIAVVIILLLFFRNIELTLITIIPIALTWVITIGVMGLLGTEFNIFNIIISTFIFGLGIDYSIFITNGLLKEYKYGVKELKTYKTSILLSVITTILGVGALIFAKHPALKSVSIVSIIGILSAVFVAFTIQPLLFRFFVTGRTKKALAPLRVRTFLHAMVLFTFYGVGGMLLSLFSVTILRILPISKKKKMKWLHNAIAKLVTAVLYGNPFVKKEVINPNNETFEKPAIIISNHVSFLDTLTIGLATPNVIYLVNDWVYKSPVFGLLAKVVGFYPVSSGVDGSLDHLKEKINQGYCLVVFPEARRSFTNKIGRFHKGAFFLANKLELDILPMYLHGNSEVLPKRDIIIYDGSLTVKIGKRIKYNDTSYGDSDREQTKKIGSFYKDEFNKFRNEIEQVGYFKGILLSNYQYKGYKLLQIIKDDYNQNKELYKTVADILPLKAEISHLADNYGQLDILLVSRSIDRKITTFIDDDEKQIIASNCYTTMHRKVNYVQTIDKLITKKTTILIISSGSKKLISELKNPLPVELREVILIDNEKFKDYFSERGFNRYNNETNIIHLKKV
ncbi:MAG: MMPL family transporter [Flavobacteriaceae bacterium]|nr:MMPL family transporter [Flavobacteriaceae bacterium]